MTSSQCNAVLKYLQENPNELISAVIQNTPAGEFIKEISSKLITPCGGCGAKDESDRCIGCFHQFYPTPEKVMKTDKEAKELIQSAWSFFHKDNLDNRNPFNSPLG